MSFQTEVRTFQPFGKPGEFYDNSPRRVDPYVVKGVTASGTSTGAIFGRVYTIASDTPTGDNPPGTPKAVMGGTGVFAGLLVNPDEHANPQNLTPSNALGDGTVGGLCKMGRVIVEVATAVTIGQSAIYTTATGAISSTSTPSEPGDGNVLIPNAKFFYVPSSANNLAVLELTD